MWGTPLEDVICIVIVLCVLSGCVGTLDYKLPATRIYMWMNVSILWMDVTDLIYLLGKDGYSLIESEAVQRMCNAGLRGLRYVGICIFLCLMGWLLAVFLNGHFHSVRIAKMLTLLCVLTSICFLASSLLTRYFFAGSTGTWLTFALYLDHLSFGGMDFMRLLVFYIILANARNLEMFHFFSLLSFMLMPFFNMLFYVFFKICPEIFQSPSSSCSLILYHLTVMILHVPIVYSLALLVYFVLIQVDIGRRVQRRKMELATNRLKMAVGFVQPHFLYNALTSIYYLCDKDPQAAKQNIGDFTHYLRESMMGITGQPLIPFERELDHVRYYLQLEQLRFGDEIKARFDIQELDFQVPALSVEHLVENAVKHGIYEKEKGGTVKVSSFSTSTEFHVCVEDDGVGFDKKILKDLDPSHFGLNVVEEILEIMCQGKMKIYSELGKGTKVELVIPRKE